MGKLHGEGHARLKLTDPDSQFMQERKGVIMPAYNCQLAVAEGQVIVGAEVVAEANDRNQLLPMLEQTEEVTGAAVRTVMADSGSSSCDNYEALATKGTNGYIPDQYLAQRQQSVYRRPEHRYHKENFQYNPARDLYLCPEGKPLRWYKERDSSRGVIKRRQLIYKGTNCAGCAVRPHCTRAPARTLVREKREALQEAMRRRLLVPEGKEPLGGRYTWWNRFSGISSITWGIRPFC